MYTLYTGIESEEKFFVYKVIGLLPLISGYILRNSCYSRISPQFLHLCAFFLSSHSVVTPYSILASHFGHLGSKCSVELKKNIGSIYSISSIFVWILILSFILVHLSVRILYRILLFFTYLSLFI